MVIDPIDASRRFARAERCGNRHRQSNFWSCAERYIDAHKAGWRNPKHAAQWPATLETYVYPVFGELPVQAIDAGLVMKAIEPIWTTKPETASRVRGRIESVLDWATARGYRQGENPARWRGHLENLLPTRARCGGSSTMRRCPMPRSPPSWPSCGSRKASPPARSNSRS